MVEEVYNTTLQTTGHIAVIEFTQPERSTDDQLVASVLAGDDTAFSEIFDRHKYAITRTVGRFFGDRNDVEEFVQQSFTKAYFSLQKYRGDSEKASFGAWVKRIAINVCYDEFRRRHRRSESLFTEICDEENDYVASISDPNQTFADQSVQAAQLAKKILSALAPDDRVAMTLVYSQDYSLDEAAEVLGITTGNLKSRLFRCRNHIKKRFGHLFT